MTENTEHKVIIGAHNALTGGEPANWLTRIFGFFAKCQGKTYQQLRDETECRCWDIRLFWKNSEWHTGHGLLEYKMPVSDIDALLCNIQQFAKRPTYVRLTLERDGAEEGFKVLCAAFEAVFGKDITFLGGRRKSDWSLLYDFGTDDIPLQQWVSSMASNAWHIERWMPWIYAKRCNGRNLQQAVCGINLYDFL